MYLVRSHGPPGVTAPLDPAPNRPPHRDLQRAAVADELEDFDRRERELLAAMNATLHRPPDAPVATPEETAVPPEPPALSTLVASTLADRALLRQLAGAADAEQEAARAADAERSPDITVWAGYRLRRDTSPMDPGEDLVSIGPAIPLPWLWNDERWGEQAAEHRALGRAHASRRANAVDALRGGLEAARARWTRGFRRAKTYREELVPAARTTLDATFAAYRVGRADFGSVFQAELRLLGFERAILESRTLAARAAVEVATLRGAAAPPPRPGPPTE